METPKYRLLPTVVFYLIASGLAWVFVFPLWLSEDGVKSPSAMLFIVGMMFTPTIAAFFVSRVCYKYTWRQTAHFLGMSFRQPYGRLLKWLAIATILGTAIPLLTPFVASLLGLYNLDIMHLSGLTELTEEATGEAGPSESAARVIIITQLAFVPVGILINIPFCAGEEIGWRGYLLPSLVQLGTLPALIISGALWGLWHSPIILLGYNFERTDWTGVALMTVGCVFLGILIGATRLFSQSAWPAAFFHAAFNTTAGVGLMIGASGQDADLAYINPLGVAGWIITAIIGLVVLPKILKLHRSEVLVDIPQPAEASKRLPQQP